MAKISEKTSSILHFLGRLLVFNSVFLLIPVACTAIYWGEHGDGWRTLLAFLLPSISSFCTGFAMLRRFRYTSFGTAGALLLCALAWLAFSFFGALPFVTGINSSFLDGYFEAMSGYTTTGITVYDGLIDLPRSILFWRSLTQWVGGLGILSFFLVISIAGVDHNLYSAESHKIVDGRPTPGLTNTVRLLWGVYLLFTLFGTAALSVLGMPVFESLCHTFTALSTGGFSPHDASLAYYQTAGYSNYRFFEYVLTILMMLGGMKFLIHYKVLRGHFRSLWGSTEIRWLWYLFAGFLFLLMADHLMHAEFNGNFEELFRKGVFQVASLLTTTGFGTEDINSPYFPGLTKTLFLVMMFIGGCVGSTGGGFKVLRVIIMGKLLGRELFKSRVSSRASNDLVIDHRIMPTEEAERVSSLFFAWVLLVVAGGAVTALFSQHGPLESASGMLSAVSNIGPCYISAPDLMVLHPVIKVTYIFGMLAGRLEIIPVLLLFSPKAWR